MTSSKKRTTTKKSPAAAKKTAPKRTGSAVGKNAPRKAAASQKSTAKSPVKKVKSSPAATKGKTASAKSTKSAPQKTPARPAASKPGKTKPAAKPAPSTAKGKTPAKSPVKKVADTKKTATKPAPAAKAAKATVTAKASKPAPAEAVPVENAAPRNPAIVLNARRRKGTPAVFKTGQRKSTPIVFSLEDVHEILRKKDTSTAPETETEAESAITPESAAKPAAKPTADDGKLAGKEKKTAKRVLGAASLADILGFDLSSKDSYKPEGEVPRKWTKYYRQLIELRDQVKEGLDLHTQLTLKRSAKEDTGDLSGYGQHMADAGTDTFDRDFALNLVSSEKEALYEINEAIKRIHNGTYGVCEITGQPISKERLSAVPFTRYSLEGQRELEKGKRRTRSRSEIGLFTDADDSSLLASDDDSES